VGVTQAHTITRVLETSGSARRSQATPLDKFGVSPDGDWVIVWSPGAGDQGEGTFAIPTHGGAARKICEGCWATWSADGRFFYVALNPASSSATISSGTTLAIPVPVGKPLPDLPTNGIALGTAVIDLPRARVIEHNALSPGPDPST
jgi:hypothetical protein